MTRPLYLAVLAAFLTLAAPEARAQTPLGVFAQLDRYADNLLVLRDGRVLVADDFEAFAFAPDGIPLGEFGSNAGLPFVELADERILIGGGRSVDSYDGSGMLLGMFAVEMNFPGDAVQLADGRILFAETELTGDPGDGRLSLFDPDGTRLPDFATGVLTPTAVVQLPDGRILVAEYFSRRISSFAPDGTPLGAFADLNGVEDLLILPDGRVLVADLDSRGGGIGISILSPEGEYLGDFADRAGRSLALTLDGRVLLASGDAVYAYGVVTVSNELETPEGSGVGAVFPQPLASGAAAGVEVTPEAPGAVTIRVYDALGRLVAEERVRASAGRQRLRVPVSGLSAGVYGVRVEGAGLAASRRVIVAE